MATGVLQTPAATGCSQLRTLSLPETQMGTDPIDIFNRQATPCYIFTRAVKPFPKLQEAVT